MSGMHLAGDPLLPRLREGDTEQRAAEGLHQHQISTALHHPKSHIKHPIAKLNPRF